MFKNMMRIVIGLIVGEWNMAFTVDTTRFPFHHFWHNHVGKVKLEQRQGPKGQICWILNTEVGIIPYSLNKAGLKWFFVKLAIKGSVKNLYGGISLRILPARYEKITLLNAILSRLGYVMLESEENTVLRSVLHVLKNNNKQLKEDVKNLESKVQSHEELLTRQIRFTHDMSGELNDTKQDLSNTQSDLRFTNAKLLTVEARLDDTETQLQKMQKQTDALCSYLGIQSVDEFLDTVMRNAAKEQAKKEHNKDKEE